jgi:hypothetical protein
MGEAEASALKSGANAAVRAAQRALDAARRPKLGVAEARERLAAEEQRLADAWEQLGRIQADANSSDPAAQLRALDADAAGAAKAVRRAEIAAEVARQTLRDAEARERGQRLPLFEIRATAIAKRLDEKLAALAEIVDEAVELAVQARAAGVQFDAPIYPGLLPERIEYWRSQQQAAGRLA